MLKTRQLRSNWEPTRQPPKIRIYNIDIRIKSIFEKEFRRSAEGEN